ncbi:MAG: GNAT family N-acetyltransferase [Thermoplasmata archaeon]
MAAAAGPIEGFRLRRLEKPEEFRQADLVRRLAWGGEDGESVSPVLQRAVQDNGGLVLGAFADIYLAGFALGFLGFDGEQLYHYVHLLAVRPEYQNHRVGNRLMTYYRDEAIHLGLSEMRWTFDPLQSKNAMLYVRRLGARPDRYHSHYYGQMTDAINQGLETDRVRAVWALSTPAVEARLAGTFPSAAEDQQRWASSEPILETEPGESGIRVPTAVTEPSKDASHIEVPFDLDLVRTHEREGLGHWRHAVRDAFRAAYDLGHRVEDFAVISADHERRSFYLLRRAAPDAPAPNEAPPRS